MKASIDSTTSVIVLLPCYELPALWTLTMISISLTRDSSYERNSLSKSTEEYACHTFRTANAFLAASSSCPGPDAKTTVSKAIARCGLKHPAIIYK